MHQEVIPAITNNPNTNTVLTTQAPTDASYMREVMALVAVAEQGSEHPLGIGVHAYASTHCGGNARGLEAEEFEAIPGAVNEGPRLGLRGMVRI